MATLTIRNVPDELYERLKQAAERNRRSLNNEAIILLEEKLFPPQRTPEEIRSILETARKLRDLDKFHIPSNEALTAAKEEGRP